MGVWRPGARAKMIRDGKRRPRDADESVESFKPWPGVHSALLIGKMHEEIQEVANEPRDVYEYGDVLELLYEFGRKHGVTPAMMEAARLDKRDRVGGFEDALFYERSGYYKES